MSKLKERSHPYVVDAEAMQWWKEHTKQSMFPRTKSGKIMSKQQICFAMDQLCRKHGYAGSEDLDRAFRAAKALDQWRFQREEAKA